MSADFWASYASGALGILIGNRLDVLKVQAQAGLSSLPSQTPTSSTSTSTSRSPPSSSVATPSIHTSSTLPQHHQQPQQKPLSYRLNSLFRGAAAPILGYGALNSILFMTFNRTLATLDPTIPDYTKLAGVDLSKIFAAGTLGGLATWIVSAPSEYIKCRAQLRVDGAGSSLAVFRATIRKEGVRGLYMGGLITSIRDGVGYGWYFWSYELMKRLLVGWRSHDPFVEMKTMEVLIAGGVAGVVTWVSIYPLDVIKTRLQTRASSAEEVGLLSGRQVRKTTSSREVAAEIWREGGLRAFYRGVGVCSLRAFVVNAVQWYAYERIMVWLGPMRSPSPMKVG